MKRIALTGGIATGKSHVLRLFRQHGIPTLDADQVSRAVVDVSQPAYQLLRSRFGAGYFLDNGQLNRTALGKFVFENQTARADLEAIVHPAVRGLIDKWFFRCSGLITNNVAIAEIPLLFETKRTEAFDGVLVVSCPPNEQVRRIINRDNLSTEDAQKRLAAQLPISDKITAASWVIRTDGTEAYTAQQVERLCLSLQST